MRHFASRHHIGVDCDTIFISLVSSVLRQENQNKVEKYGDEDYVPSSKSKISRMKVEPDYFDINVRFSNDKYNDKKCFQAVVQAMNKRCQSLLTLRKSNRKNDV